MVFHVASDGTQLEPIKHTRESIERCLDYKLDVFVIREGQDPVFPGMEIKHTGKRCCRSTFVRCHFSVSASMQGQAGSEELEEKHLS